MFYCIFFIFITSTSAYSSSILVSCHPAHLTLKSLSDATQLRAVTSSQCSILRKNQLIYDKNCIDNNSSLIVHALPKFVETETPDIFRTTCSDSINDYSTFQQKTISLNVKQLNNSHLAIDIIIHNQTIIDNRSLFPTQCQIIDETNDILLSDETGCQLTEAFSPFEVSSIGYNRLFTSFINLEKVILSDNSIRIQCSLVPCGMECLKKCPHHYNSFGFANQQILSKFLKVNYSKDLEKCDFGLYRLLLFFMILILLGFSSAMAYIASRIMPRKALRHIVDMLKHTYGGQKHKSRVQIVHPFDRFSTPPVITNESVASIKASGFLNVGITSDDTKSNTDSTCVSDHIDVNELEKSRTNSTEIYLSPSILDSLPDPPTISVKELKCTMEKNEKMETIRLPQPPPRYVSSRNDTIYAVPPIHSYPPPPLHPRSTSYAQTCSSESSPRLDFSSLLSSPAFNGLAMIDDEIEFNTLDRPLAASIAAELRKTYRNSIQLDPREIEF